MRDLNEQFKTRKIDTKRLIEYGFKYENDCYIYRDKLLSGAFEMIVKLNEGKEFKSYILDLENNDEYLLVDVISATGEFVGKVRQEYENKLQDIISNCFILDIFKSNQSEEIIKYVKEKYKDELEYLWKNSNNAILRNKETGKWYAALLKIPESKLNSASNNIIEVIDLRYQKHTIDSIIDNKKVFPGYHMNKKSWITIKLDNSVDTKEIFTLIDNSYNLSKKV